MHASIICTTYPAASIMNHNNSLYSCSCRFQIISNLGQKLTYFNKRMHFIEMEVQRQELEKRVMELQLGAEQQKDFLFNLFSTPDPTSLEHGHEETTTSSKNQEQTSSTPAESADQKDKDDFSEFGEYWRDNDEEEMGFVFAEASEFMFDTATGKVVSVEDRPFSSVPAVLNDDDEDPPQDEITKNGHDEVFVGSMSDDDKEVNSNDAVETLLDRNQGAVEYSNSTILSSGSSSSSSIISSSSSSSSSRGRINAISTAFSPLSTPHPKNSSVSLEVLQVQETGSAEEYFAPSDDGIIINTEIEKEGYAKNDGEEDMDGEIDLSFLDQLGEDDGQYEFSDQNY
uniref:Uncharacterized protein n=1 Tax=Heterosigma akashiwo TaxID=2829 RepID=A0A7S3XW47_HETAK